MEDWDRKLLQVYGNFCLLTVDYGTVVWCNLNTWNVKLRVLYVILLGNA